MTFELRFCNKNGVNDYCCCFYFRIMGLFMLFSLHVVQTRAKKKLQSFLHILFLLQLLQIARSKEFYLKWTLTSGNGFLFVVRLSLTSKKSVEKLDFILLFYVLNRLKVIQNILKLCYY